MSVLKLGKALSDIKSYDSCFKVDIRLYEPLWKYHFSTEEIALEVLSLLSQLEPLCKEEYTKHTGGILPEHRMEYLNSFVPSANIAVGKMREYLSLMPNSMLTLQDYLKQNGLGTLFPRSYSYICNQTTPVFKSQKSLMDGYFSHLAMINQLMSLGNQLNSDVNNHENHKYVAHQVALLYQAVNQAGSSMGHVKKQIEDNFKNLKESLAHHKQNNLPRLPNIQKEWINCITGEILNCLMSLEAPINQPIRPAVHFLQHL